ncbi:hypothetical protein GIS00_22355 [Nakamurella sp. YIM 132087]|uniref:Uncharacterized protein n=1 Tax=Nakamurella alba TaxID=2665158 RepID=A0A7K1FRA4_9ACTN|nr:hypothetical protein [Nakamurella alba]MTD16682.1 hypothetical protein [Nakamurella alba]
MTAVVAGVMAFGMVSASASGPARTAAAPDPLVELQQASFVAITPCRIVDTRVQGGLFVSKETRSFVASGTTGFQAQGGKAGGCDIPVTASSITANISSVGATGKGYIRAWAADSTEPNATLLSYNANESGDNHAVIPIVPGGSPAFKMKNYAGPTGVVIDVTGYYAAPITLSLDSLGNVLNGSAGIENVLHPSTGTYLVDTGIDVTNCVPTAVSSSPLGGILGSTAEAVVTDVNTIEVKVGALGLGGLLTLVDAPTVLHLVC